jgi:hypothetical protein
LWGYAGYQALARGVVTPRADNKIILFITKDKPQWLEQYEDDLAGNVLHWEGPSDHFAEARMVAASEEGDEFMCSIGNVITLTSPMKGSL